MVTCCICGHEFEPNPDEVKAWAESGRQFDPTDWTCPECLEAISKVEDLEDWHEREVALAEVEYPDGYFKVSI
jgi:rubredoxin